LTLNLEQKIGQMIISGFRGTKIDQSSQIVRDIKNFSLGGIWLTDNESPMADTIGNISDSSQLRTLIKELQSFSNIPLFISIDAEGGKVIRLKEKFGFPKTYSAKFLGELDDPDQTFAITEKLVLTLKELNINLNFAPVLDLNINPENPAIGGKERCFSDNPIKVVAHAKEVVKAHRKHNIITSVKHFPGHGNSKEDTHLGFVDITQTWKEDELLPYESLLESELVDTVMSSHLFHKSMDPQFPASLSKKILTNLLRDTLGFNGVIFSDDMNMKAISAYYDYEFAIQKGIEAGIDVFIQGNALNYDPDIVSKTHSIILRLVDEGKVTEERINQSYQRILNLKKSFQIIE